VVLYEMLEGRRPFRATDDVELERAIRSGARPEPLQRSLPAAFGAMLDRAFAPALADRYASAQEMENDLRGVLLDGDDATRRTGAAGSEITRRSAEAVAAPESSAQTRRTLPVNGAAAAEATHRSAGVAASPAAIPAAPAATAAAPAVAAVPKRKRRI